MKNFIVWLTGTFAAAVLLFASGIVLIDPYCVLHKPWFGMEPAGMDNAHYIARGLIRNLDYDILVCGSSMCENMHTDYVDAVFPGSKSIKVVQHGSYSGDLEASLTAAAEAGKADVVIMALDTAMWRKPGEGYRLGEMPAYTIKKPSFTNIAPYILNLNIFYTAISVLKQNLDGNAVRMNDWWLIGDECYSEDAVYASCRETMQNGYGLGEFDAENAYRNLENIKKGVEACAARGIEIKFFIPPYSAAEFLFSNDASYLDAYKKLWSGLLSYSNVEIFAIQFDTGLISDLNLYRNTGHYNGKVCDRIIDDIANGAYRLTKENLDSEIGRFSSWLETYDWEELKQKSGI